MFDAILTKHHNRFTCGVAAFNQQLGERLGVPVLGLWDTTAKHPLISVKMSELSMDEDLPALWQRQKGSFDLLWHDGDSPMLSEKAAHVWRADDIGAPSLLGGNPTRPGKTIFTFGMAHKTSLPHFASLKSWLDDLRQPYTVCVSSAVHEGQAWAHNLERQYEWLHKLFGDHLRMLGFLADDGLAQAIRDAHFVALFYQPCVRANNTTLWAALQTGTPVITNLGPSSPPELVHTQSVFDLNQMTEWPTADVCRIVRFGGKKAAKAYGWDRVLNALGQGVHV